MTDKSSADPSQLFAQALQQTDLAIRNYLQALVQQAEGIKELSDIYGGIDELTLQKLNFQLSKHIASVARIQQIMQQKRTLHKLSYTAFPPMDSERKKEIKYYTLKYKNLISKKPFR